MKAWKKAAMAAGVALLAGCHPAPAVGPQGAAVPAARGGTAKAERYRTLSSSELCRCPLRLRVSGDFNATPSDVVVNNFKSGEIRQPVFDVTFAPNGAVAGTFSYTGFDYEEGTDDNFPGEPAAGFPHGSSIAGAFTGDLPGGFNPFDYPPTPTFGSEITVVGTLTPSGTPFTGHFGVRRVETALTLPVTNDDVINYVVIRVPSLGLEIYSDNIESGFFGAEDNDYDSLIFEQACPG